jgi:hypothetical protein
VDKEGVEIDEDRKEFGREEGVPPVPPAELGRPGVVGLERGSGYIEGE